MQGSNGSANTKKDGKSREKAGKRTVAAGSNIAFVFRICAPFDLTLTIGG